MSHPKTFLIFLLLSTGLQAQAEPVHHDLEVRLRPADHLIEVVDTITVPKGVLPSAGLFRFWLHGSLELKSEDPRFQIRQTSESDRGSVGKRQYTVVPADGKRIEAPWKIKLRYAGKIFHPLESVKESARAFSSTPGIIDAQGVVLSGASGWIPEAGGEYMHFRLAVELPAAWDVVSEGNRIHHEIRDGSRHVTWDCPRPMTEIHLIAAQFTEYSRQAGNVLSLAFLRTPDPNLAARYLEVTAQYVGMYEKLIGPYPYKKFALVENFWETGYGMPSFTLLGPKIIRFPFILHSSYPHEILHNWWGNSVFVRYEQGNWCEGLTAYLADHLVKEGQGKGEEYRQDTLKKYRNYVRDRGDFPLSDFRERHSAATEAVGYGKSLMLFHMLRHRVGDEAFSLGLSRFYRKFKFKHASFGDIRDVFSGASKQDLKGFFSQWVTRTGAPVLELGKVDATAQGSEHRVSVEVLQSQEGPAYELSVPVAFTFVNRKVVEKLLPMAQKSAVLQATFESAPLRVEVDPRFDLFRRLHRDEIPPSLGQVFGADKITLVLPEQGREKWRVLANEWADEGAEIKGEEELRGLPADRALWILGSRNRWVGVALKGLEKFGAGIDRAVVSFGPIKATIKGHCFIFTVIHPSNPDLAIGWIGADDLAALPGLTRKLPHYGKYSYLAFSGTEPSNTVKGKWPSIGSPLLHDLAKDVHPAVRPARKPLARLAPVFDQGALAAHVGMLSSEEFDGRGAGTAGLDKAAKYIAEHFAKAGLRPGGDDNTWFQTWTEKGGPDGRDVRLRNVVGVLRGGKQTWEKQSVVLGAHYDHLGRGWPDARAGQAGKIHPGADDNASGVSVLIEVARLLGRELKPDRTLVFVAFAGEEWGLRGSRHYVRTMKLWPVSDVMAMMNMDTVGRLGKQKITLLGTGSASEWVHIARGIGFTTGVSATCVADDLGSSDQKSFLDAGVPAVQVFTGANEDYHRPTDTADKVDSAGLVKIATFVRESVVYLTAREHPMTSSLGKRREPSEGVPEREPQGTSRRVSLGTMPDFAWQGSGVKVTKVLPGTPAEKAGILAGDLITAIDGKDVPDLRGYSDILKAHKPGDEITVHVERNGKQLKLKAKLVAR